ncbi:MAG: hypothetical protein JO269_09680 [Burkholderiaceae bacterium]|nr:hypothetical protein [Burkholderiaceae bacterium]
MTNPFYTVTGNPLAQTRGTSAAIRSEFSLIQAAFGLLPVSAYAVDTGTVNSIVVSINSAITSYTDGLVLIAKIANTTTSTTPTINANGLGAVTITHADGTALNPGDLIAGKVAAFIYNATTATWQCMTTLSCATQAVSDNSTKLANTAFVQQLAAFFAAQGAAGQLPNQAGNGGKNLTTNGTTSSWGFSATPEPQGRLTLTSNTPVMPSDITAATSIYYAPYRGNGIPIYNGTYLSSNLFSQLTLALDSNSGHTGYQQSGNLYDLFVFLNSGTPTLCTGPAWSSTTSRGTGAGTTQLQLLNGVWTNAVQITAKIDATSTTVTVAANQATYVGTMYATANGQTAMQFAPTAATGGTNNMLALYNAYNRVRVDTSCQDSTTSWTYATPTWRSADNSNSNRISFVDGLQQSFVNCSYTETCTGYSSGPHIGVNLDSTSATPNFSAAMNNTGAGAQFMSISTGMMSFNPQLGFHYLQAMEYSKTTTSTFYGKNYDDSSPAMFLTASLEM